MKIIKILNQLSSRLLARLVADLTLEHQWFAKWSLLRSMRNTNSPFEISTCYLLCKIGNKEPCPVKMRLYTNHQSYSLLIRKLIVLIESLNATFSNKSRYFDKPIKLHAWIERKALFSLIDIIPFFISFGGQKCCYFL